VVDIKKSVRSRVADKASIYGGGTRVADLEVANLEWRTKGGGPRVAGLGYRT